MSSNRPDFAKIELVVSCGMICKDPLLCWAKTLSLSVHIYCVIHFLSERVVGLTMQRLSAGNFRTYDCLELIRIWKKKWNHWYGTHEKNNIWTSSAAACGHCISFVFNLPFPPLRWRWMRSELLLVGLVEARICSVLWFRPGCITSLSYKWCADKGVPVCSDLTPSWNVIFIHHYVSGAATSSWDTWVADNRCV